MGDKWICYDCTNEFYSKKEPRYCPHCGYEDIEKA